MMADKIAQGTLSSGAAFVMAALAMRSWRRPSLNHCKHKIVAPEAIFFTARGKELHMKQYYVPTELLRVPTRVHAIFHSHSQILLTNVSCAVEATPSSVEDIFSAALASSAQDSQAKDTHPRNLDDNVNGEASDAVPSLKEVCKIAQSQPSDFHMGSASIHDKLPFSSTDFLLVTALSRCKETALRNSAGQGYAIPPGVESMGTTG